MSLLALIPTALQRFQRSEKGAAFVELAVILPSFVIFFAVAVEGGRTFWSYQAAQSGLRDATRYMSRVTPLTICQTGGDLDSLQAKLTDIVRNNSAGGALFPSSITIDSVTADLVCVDGDYRVSPAPVGTVTATMSITYPFASSFQIIGVTLEDITTVISDTSRIFGA